MEENSEISLNESPAIEEVSLKDPEIVVENGIEKDSAVDGEVDKKFKDLETTISNLRNELVRKTDVISDLEKQRGQFEKEVTHVRKHSSCDRPG